LGFAEDGWSFSNDDADPPPSAKDDNKEGKGALQLGKGGGGDAGFSTALLTKREQLRSK